MTDEDQTWRVGELARETGLTVRALHHYDRLGLLSPSSRTQGGQRCYTSEDLRRLHRLIALRGFGLSLEEIKGVLDADVHHDPADLLRRHLAALDERIRKSTDLRGRLLAVLDALDRSVEPSTTQFLRLIEETITVTRPLTAEQFARLVAEREQRMRQLSSEELAAMHERRERWLASSDPDERARLHARRRAMAPWLA